MHLRYFIQKSFLLILFFTATVGAFAQTPGEPQPKKIADAKDRIIVDFDYDGFLNLPAGIKQKPYSLGGNAYFMWDYPFGYGPFSVAFGGGFSTHDMHSNGRITYTIDGKYTTLEPLTTQYKRNKLSCNYVEIPVELRIRTRGQHSFKFSVGVKAGYAYNVHTKIIDDDGKRKIYDIKNINPWRYGVTMRIGYNKFVLQGFYAFSDLFKKGRGEPNMVPFSVGVGLLLY